MRSRARPTTKADETPEFVEFWTEWRKHARHTDGRGAARDEFMRHVEEHGVDGRDIADGAHWFFHTMKPSDREFVPLASSWMNRRSYEDSAEEWRAYQARRRSAPTHENVVPIQPAGKTRFLREFERARGRG